MRPIRCRFLVCLALALTAGLPLLANPKPPEKPADIKIVVDPSIVAAGGTTVVRVDLAPIKGVKINRYPHIKLSVPERPGLVAAGSVSVGSDPPPPDKLSGNYFESVDPVELELQVHEDADRGPHEVVGKLSYFYCMPASGFCAPHRVAVTIPLTVD